MKKPKQQLAFFDGSNKARTAEVSRRVALTPEAERLLANFEVLGEASGGTKRLRELILGLAVQGKLVPQDAQDESAEILADKIASAKPRLAARWSMRIGERLPPVKEADEPYAIPASWRWIRLGDCGGFLGGGTPSKANSSFWEGAMPWVSPKDMKRPYIDDAEDHISEAAVEGSSVKLIPTGSLLFVIRGMILAHSFPTALTTKPVTINQDMKALVLALPALGEYLLRACQAARPRMLQRVERSSHGTCRLDSDEVERFPIALPPLAEQARIVAKVDELMALCDELEARQAKRRVMAGRLNKAALGELTSAEGPEEFAASLQRVLGNFEALADKPESVGELRNLIRGLACDERLLSVQTADAVWTAAQLSEIAETVVDCPHSTPAWTSSGIICLRTTNFRSTGLDLREVRFVGRETYDLRVARLVPKAGDVVYSREGGILGIACVIPDIGLVCLGQRMMLIRSKREVCTPDWLTLVLNAPTILARVVELTGGTAAPHLNVGDVKAFDIPLPPLAEQARIVAKVDQLMALCDTLEAKIRAADEGARRLAESLVAELIA